MDRPIPLAVTARVAALRLPVPGALYRLPRPLGWRLTGPGPTARHGVAENATLMLHDLMPATTYRLCVEGMEEIRLETRSCPGAVLPAGLAKGSAPGDVETAARNGEAIARAIATLPLGGTLILPPGEWVSAPVALRSDMVLHLSRGAVLRAPADRAGWPIVPAQDAAGHMLGSWEGLPADCFAAGLHAIGAQRLTIEGPGIIDGSGDLGDWWSWPKETRQGARRPRGLHLIDCVGVRLLGFTIRNAPSWTIHPQGCHDLLAAGLTIEAPHDSPNTDGLNPEMCRDVAIEGVRFSVGDDCIAIKAGKRGAAGEADHLAETRHVRVRHCVMERGHGGLVIGSEMSGGIHDVAIEDCEMTGTDRGLRIKTRRGRGGEVSGIAMRRVRMSGVQTAISVNAHYHCDADGHSSRVQDRAPAPVDETTPRIDGITVEDVMIDGLAHAAGSFLGLAESPIRNVRVRGLRIMSLDRAASPALPDMADHLRPLLHETLLAEQADLDCDDPDLISAAPITLEVFHVPD